MNLEARKGNPESVPTFLGARKGCCPGCLSAAQEVPEAPAAQGRAQCSHSAGPRCAGFAVVADVALCAILLMIFHVFSFLSETVNYSIFFP